MGMTIALLSALFIGSTSVVATKIGGKATQQSLGMTVGAVIFGMLTALLFVWPRAGLGYVFNPRIWLVGFVSGLFWSVGQIGQFTALKPLGVSIAMPISTAGQVIGNALMAAIVLGEWTTVRVWIVGLVSIALVTVGAVCTSAQPKSKRQRLADQALLNSELPAADAVTDLGADPTATSAITSPTSPAAPKIVSKKDFRKGLTAIAISTVGYMLYFVFPNLLHKVGFIANSVYDAPNGDGLYYMTSIVLPQSFGQIVGVLAIMGAMNCLMNRRAGRPVSPVDPNDRFFVKKTWQNIASGLVWAVGNVCIFIACASPSVGQAIATTFSQLGVIVATFGGIVVLHERKTKRQMIFIVIGCLLLVAGAILMGLFTSK
ncbi:GRP family sugar transporter [Bifidobacterium choloepi]|uniref:Glucose transporter n=1 Tax=Bifidobacterium choloepi TaxID=2614131 RepID=A0A6I5NFM5_9BIFI|nr:GRP family sugar transporter [Bifidobacterium choloepi]NEG70144.1 glucose transporter [Bifidobacterium choloepi]